MSEEVVVVGAGGHAKVCIELLRASGKLPVVCVGSEGDPDYCLGIPVLKGDSHLRDLLERGLQNAFVAIGDNRLRERLANSLSQLGFQFANAISPAAILSPSAEIGQGVAIMSGVVINACVKIGDFSIINTGAAVDHDCNIGRAAHVAPGCTLAGSVNVGDSSFLGIGTLVIPNVSIGRSTKIGAGSVVIRDIPDNILAFGIPAQKIRVAEEK